MKPVPGCRFPFASFVLCFACSLESSGNGTPNAGGAGAGGSAAGVAGATAGGSSAGAPPDTGGAGAAGGGASSTAGSGNTTAGSAGTGGSSGTGGSAGGSSGSSGSSGGGGSAGAASSGSEGCGEAPNQPTASWVESMVEVGAGSRPYSVFLPSNYDASRTYPVILLLHGCGSGTNNLPMEDQAGSDAIVVRGTGSDDGCWDADPGGADVPYVDAMIEDVEARFCADTSAVFAVGYSSGSWLANQLGCVRADVFRGLATVAGGLPGGGDCADQPIAHMFVHDLNDESNLIEWNEPARDRLLEVNGCDQAVEPLAVEPSPCVSYQGCDPGYPVVWCATSGQGHARQDAFAAPAFWDFFQSLLHTP